MSLDGDSSNKAASESRRPPHPDRGRLLTRPQTLALPHPNCLPKLAAGFQQGAFLKLGCCLIFVLLVVAPPFAKARRATSETGIQGQHTRASAPAIPSAYSKEPYVIEKYSTRVQFDTDGSQTRTIFARVRIQSDLAAQKFSHLAFDYDSIRRLTRFPIRTSHQARQCSR